MHRILLSSLAALWGIGLASTALGQVVAPPVVTVPGMSTVQSQILAQLVAAHKLLAVADRDYKGHRAKAAREVRNAMKSLSYRHHSRVAQPGAAVAAAAGANAAKTAATTPAVHKPQAISDNQLRQAQQILLGLATQLNGSRPKVGTHVTAAIGEINTALSIK